MMVFASPEKKPTEPPSMDHKASCICEEESFGAIVLNVFGLHMKNMSWNVCFRNLHSDDRSTHVLLAGAVPIDIGELNGNVPHHGEVGSNRR